MKTKLFRSLAAAWLFLAAPAAFAQITVGNVRAAQRVGTKLVDIDYDLTDLATPCYVWLDISGDGGSTWAVAATTLTGAVGANVTPGTNLRITWNAGVDWNGVMSPQTRFRIRASDGLPDLENFAAIPAGSFQMGDALDGLPDAPVHTVNVSAFYMQKKGVTKAEWDAVRAWGLTHGYTDLAAGAGKAANHPVQTVSWYDGVKWCNARSEQEALTPCYYTDAAQTAIFKTSTINIDSTMVKWTANGYRLPTEAEREKASRGGQVGLRFPWGTTINHANANFYNAGDESYATGAGGYDPVWSTGAQPTPRRRGVSRRTPMASSIWRATWVNGAGIGTAPATTPPLRVPILPGLPGLPARPACCAAVPGSSTPSAAAQPFATPEARAARATASGSVPSAGRRVLPLNSRKAEEEMTEDKKKSCFIRVYQRPSAVQFFFGA